MSTKIKTKTMSTFAEDVRAGLRAEEKHLSSKYFYDQRGSEIFQVIMRMPSYYLTDSEFEIFETNKEAILQHFDPGAGPFNLVEFGAGDGLKTKVLLEHFLERKADFTYAPIDISKSALDKLEQDLCERWPALNVHSLHNDYFSGLDMLRRDDTRNIVLFLGSNLGNFDIASADGFLAELRAHLDSGDGLFIGLDLQKDPSVILGAYDDPEGITKAFNLNLLERINRELGGHFDPMKFDFYCSYSPESGEVRSYLVSKVKQTIKIDALDESFDFQQWEIIHTEISRKFRLDRLPELARRNGFEHVGNTFDCKHYFVNSYWKAV